MIPKLNPSGVLPPFLSDQGPGVSAAMAPYQSNLTELVDRFATTPARIDIMRGLLNYRQLLHNAGITDGFQWIDGSFVENCERVRGRPPNDIDIVTFAERPSSCADNTLWQTFVDQHRTDLFDRSAIKNKFYCDAMYEDLGLPSRIVAGRAGYWFGLFSHQRVTYLWKGLLAIPLQADDQAALAMLTGGAPNAS